MNAVLANSAEATLNASCLWPIIAAIIIVCIYALLYAIERFVAWRRKSTWWLNRSSRYNHYVNKERK